MSAIDWENAKKRFPVKSIVHGKVIEHKPFGIFVDINDPVARGLVQITDFLDDGCMTLDKYPSIGTTVEAVVLGYTDERRNQIWLGMKPSQLCANS